MYKLGFRKGVLRSMGIFILAITSLKLASGQSPKCIQHESCGRCLSADPSCAWCTDPNYDMRKSRCMTEEDLKIVNCKSIHANKIEDVQMVEDDLHHDFNVGNLEAVQIRPQRTKLTLRKMQTRTIKMTYRPAKNYPLDIYCLMDMTRSMVDDKETLVSVGKDLAYTLQHLTENYRIGFGSFVDKPAMPFMPIGKAEENPCALEHEVCEKTYGFRHGLSLTNNVTQFVDIVNSTDISANLDNLEGGLDALMQVAVCLNDIGWHNQSRKIVVFASDGLIHFAGDGLLAGVIKKNDKKCHLRDDGEYMASLEYDYPSLEEIYRELSKAKINIIFAVTNQVQSLYDQFHNLMPDISSVGVLKMDSSNIIQLVENGYTDFAKKCQFFDNAPPHIRINYATRCGNLYPNFKKQAKCENIEIGKDYEFLINFTLLEYPNDGRQFDTIKIEEGSLSEFLEVDIRLEDECPCLEQEPGHAESEACNFHGELKCGMCFCDSGWSGKTCQCDLMNYNSSKELEHQCRVPIVDYRDGNETRLGPICADHGECSCGQCYCNIGFSGKYCDCNECPYYLGEPCGGEEHGSCDCGQCNCKPEWSGDRCDCPTTTSTCTAPHDNAVCSRHGVCECGVCQCSANFFGSFCETSSTMGNALCAYYEPCVKCLLERHEGMECIDLKSRCSSKDGIEFSTSFTDDISEFPIQCMLRIISKDGQTCEHHFTYKVDSSDSVSRLTIHDHQCTVINAGLAFGVGMLATFLIGCFVILFIKTYGVIQDRRECAQFEQEQQQMTKYDFQSPIYNSPLRTYEIPRCLSVEENKMDSSL